MATLCVSSASATTTRHYTGMSIGPEGTPGPAFESLQGVAVDPSDGTVYVHDAGAGGKIYKFDSSGAPEDFSALGGNAIEGVGGVENGSPAAENEMAVAPPGASEGTAGNIYLANGSSSIRAFSKAGEPLGKIEIGGEVCGVATDPAGHLFVGVYPETILEYTLSNGPFEAHQTGTGTTEGQGRCNTAADGLGNFYFSSLSGASTAKLEGLGDTEESLIEPGGPSLTVDTSTNDLYLDGGSSIAVYSPTGALLGRFGEAGLSDSRGVAVASAPERAYVDNGATDKVDVYGPTLILPEATTEAATGATAESAILRGTISAAGGPETGCEFQITTEKAFQMEGFAGAESIVCSPPGGVTGSGSVPVSAEASGLEPDVAYQFRVVAMSENGSVPALSSRAGALGFTTPGPGIFATNAIAISSTAATLTGVIDTQGEPTGYHFEYGPTVGYGSAVPIPDVAPVTPVATGDPKSSQIDNVQYSQGAFVPGQEIVGEGIRAGTTVIAVEGSTLILSQDVLALGSGVALTSPEATALVRVEGLTPGTDYHFRLVASGSVAAVPGPDATFSTFPAAGGLPEGRVYELVSQASKIGQAISPEPVGSVFNPCGEETCVPGFYDASEQMQAAPGGEEIVYEGQTFEEGLSPGINQYLARRSSGGWTSTSLTPPKAPGSHDASGFKAFSADLSRGVLLQTSPTLSPQAPGDGEESFSNLYLYEAGNPELQPLVTTQPPERAAELPAVAGTVPNNAFEVSFAGANSGAAGSPAFTHVVFEANDSLTSAVPSVAPAAPRVPEGFCKARSGDDCNLYEWADGELRLINVLSNETAAEGAVIGSGRRLGTEPASQAPDYDHAISADGGKVFWSDASGQAYVRIDGRETVKINDPGQFVSATSTGSKVLLSDGCLYAMEAGACKAHLTATPSGFLGIMGASDDLSRIYFVSPEALAPGAEERACQGEGVSPGVGCNLYVYEEGQPLSFIAAVPFTDDNVHAGVGGSWLATPSDRTAQVTADGRFLAFMSTAQLTSYENHGVFEVYEYEREAGKLECPSCDPSGTPPLGPSALALLKFHEGGAPPQPENLPADGEGRVFFDSHAVLSADDTNGAVPDVYEWRPDGVGGCDRGRGCAGLISSGRSSSPSLFVAATPDGSDAFFVTREQLLPADRDEQFDLYDARVGGGIAETTAEPCGGELCKTPAVAAAVGTTPGSSTAPPQPQFVACRKGFARKHGKCVKGTRHNKANKPKHRGKKHRKHGSHAKKPSHHHRGGSK